ncbi:MAG: hypothetical protein M3069_26015 [Chloroflexota bacterium]|nr:hypothetical protein [Chloroflexota bacterium]
MPFLLLGWVPWVTTALWSSRETDEISREFDDDLRHRGSVEGARNSGIDTGRIKLICFAIASGLCGLVAGLLWGYLHTAAPATGTGFGFRVIGAVIVGGVLLSGGRGTMYGSLVGAVIIGMITSGLVLMGFSQDIGDVATGLLIVAVGTFDLLARRAAARGMAHIGG